MPAARNSFPFLPAIALSALALLPRLAIADSFQLFTVDHTDTRTFDLGDDAGNFAISTAPYNPCGPFTLHCYLVGSAETGITAVADSLPTLGKGSTSGSHAPVDPPYGPQFTDVEQLGGIFSATYTSGSTVIRGIFDGTDPVADLLGYGTIDGGFVTPGGTVYFIDGLDNTLVVALASTATAPEPASLTLLGTGCTALAGLLARHRRRTRV